VELNVAVELAVLLGVGLEVLVSVGVEVDV
jgi:hypothetical protein